MGIPGRSSSLCVSTAAVASFLEDVQIHDPPTQAEEIARLDGIATTDASAILLAENRSDVLLANDKGLIEVARSHDVECWWVTTLLLSLAKRGTLDGDEAATVLYDLVDRGMNLHPKVYAQGERKLREIGPD